MVAKALVPMRNLSSDDKDSNENDRKQQVLISSTLWPCTRVIHFGTFFGHSLQNNNVK